MPLKGMYVWVVSESCPTPVVQKFPFGLKLSLNQMYLLQLLIALKGQEEGLACCGQKSAAIFC